MAQKPTPPTVTNPYIKVISILSSGYDATKIATELAKHHPQIFIDLYQATIEPVEAWMKDVVQFIAGNSMVSAIKLTREHTHFGLKEAKDICDHLRMKMKNIGYDIATTEVYASLSSDQYAILNKLVATATKCYHP